MKRWWSSPRTQDWLDVSLHVLGAVAVVCLILGCSGLIWLMWGQMK